MWAGRGKVDLDVSLPCCRHSGYGKTWTAREPEHTAGHGGFLCSCRRSLVGTGLPRPGGGMVSLRAANAPPTAAPRQSRHGQGKSTPSSRNPGGRARGRSALMQPRRRKTNPVRPTRCIHSRGDEIIIWGPVFPGWPGMAARPLIPLFTENLRSCASPLRYRPWSPSPMPSSSLSHRPTAPTSTTG